MIQLELKYFNNYFKNVFKKNAFHFIVQQVIQLELNRVRREEENRLKKKLGEKEAVLAAEKHAQVRTTNYFRDGSKFIG